MKILLIFLVVSCSSAPLVVDLVKGAAEGIAKREKKAKKKPEVQGPPERIYSTPEEAAEVIEEMELEACRMERQGVIFKRQIEV